MSAHTPGRLVVRGLSELHAVDGGQMRGMAGNKADARRLAACWNACEGMPTDDVEELAACNGVMVLTVYADDLREQLASARALLAEIEGVKVGADFRALEQRINQFLKAPK